MKTMRVREVTASSRASTSVRRFRSGAATGVAPVARGYQFPRNMTFECGEIAVRQAKATYADCMDRYGTEPWIDGAGIRAFDDTEFPIFMTEG